MIEALQGPILVLGAGGFIGSHIFKKLSGVRSDVYGTTHVGRQDRIKGYTHWVDVDVVRGWESMLKYAIQPKTIINCIAYGSHPDEQDKERIYETNFNLVVRILNTMPEGCVYVHAGTSSEYGYNCTNAQEDQRLTPNSDYAVSKAAASQLIEYYGKQKGIRCCNLRLYAVYGPYEQEDRLIPKLVASALEKKLPQLVAPDISRDFVYVEDVVEAFITAAYGLTLPSYGMFGESYNICTGMPTMLCKLAELMCELCQFSAVSDYTMPPRSWDKRGLWYGDYRKASFFWTARTSLREGLLKTLEWKKEKAAN